MGLESFSTSVAYDSVRGEFINAAHKRIAEILADYNPDLGIYYIPPKERVATDVYVYLVVHYLPGREPYPIMWLREDELDERVLARIWIGDSSKHDPLVYLEKLEAARQAVKLKEELDLREEMRSQTLFMLRSPLHTINMGNGRKVHT